MTEDDDWFERALADEDDPSTDDRDGAPTAAGRPGQDADEDAASPESIDDGADGDGNDGEAGRVDGPDAGEGVGDGARGGGELFEDDFASAFQDVDGPDAADAGPFGGDGGESPFGGGDGGEPPFGGSDGSAFGGGGDSPFGGDGGGFGRGGFGTGGGSPAEFDDEAVDSQIDRIDLGVDGLDEMIRGGVPERSLMTIIGSAGTGKTTFGLQFLQEGLSNGEKGVLVTLEESRERVIRSAEEKGWPFREHVDAGRLAVVDMDPIEMANSLSSIRNELPRLVDRFEATRLVLDSVSLLEMMYEDRATRRNEIYSFARSLKTAGVTVLLTSEASIDDPYASRYGIVEYLTDAVYVLQYVRPSDFRETRLAVEIQKIRDADHSREMKPYEITDTGISVYREANIF